MSGPGKPSDLGLYRRLLLEARQFWPHIAGLFALSLLSVPLTLLTPLPLKIVVDSVLGSHEAPAVLTVFLPAGAKSSDWRMIMLVAGLIILLALAKQLVDLLFVILRTYTAEQLVLAFRAKLFRHLQGLSLLYHDNSGTANSIYRIQYDAPAIQWIMIDGFIPLVSSCLTLVAMIIVMARIDWSLALVALAVVPVLYVVLQAYSRRLKLQWREAKNVENSTLSIVEEVLSSVRVVKAFAQEEREQQRYIQNARRSLREQLKLTLIGGSLGLIVGLVIATGTAGVLFIAVRHVQEGHISLGDVILVMGYLGLLYAPLQTVSNSAASLQGSLVGAERAFELLDHAPEVPEKPFARPLARARGQIEFENVSFAYNAERAALQGISFKVDAGSCVGIAGTTGAGKSTLVSLLLRFYDPTGGCILMDGVDLRDYRLPDLRNQFAVVQQEPLLFSSSIAENIAYARPRATEEEIIAAARAANADNFIRRLPQGYGTQVGERGAQLSGGERQRISLARAFLKDAPILILDEPTSSVDTLTEAAILEAMRRLMRGRTAFMIAHRLQTLENCNLLLVLEHGMLQTCTSDVSTVLRKRLVATETNVTLRSEERAWIQNGIS
jgi:ATP-binding cassette, subfamily B, bacterial